MVKLNLGCGKDIKADYINVDKISGPGVNVVWTWGMGQLPFAENHVDEVYCSHLLEHIENPLWCMQDLHRVCKSGAKVVFRLPYGSSDNAWEDPTHVRPYFVRSFSYFSQMMYGAADYGYKGDWEVEEVKLLVREAKHKKDVNEMMNDIEKYRNIVEEMIATLVCVKPMRTITKDKADTTFRLVIEAITDR